VASLRPSELNESENRSTLESLLSSSEEDDTENNLNRISIKKLMNEARLGKRQNATDHISISAMDEVMLKRFF
jgi:hypothetical protein